VFLTNSNIGIMPVSSLKPLGLKWETNEIIQQLQQRLENDKIAYVQIHDEFWRN
jgi:branched-subunit amino acid aminotransferase/4-amino-4-deoxychorismate lyase